MKKIGMILFALVLFVSFSACNGGSKKAEQEEVVEETIVVVDEVVPQEEVVEKTPAEVLKAFSEFAKEYAEAFNGLPKTITKYQELAKQSQEMIAEVSRAKDGFNAKQLKEYEKALELISNVNKGGK